MKDDRLYCPFRHDECIESCAIKINGECSLVIIAKTIFANKPRHVYSDNNNERDNELIDMEGIL